MQRVQRVVLTHVLPVSTRVDFRLGMNRRRVWTLEWLTLLPAIGPLPQRSHLWDMVGLAS
jgi:hypothetical protein